MNQYKFYKFDLYNWLMLKTKRTIKTKQKQKKEKRKNRNKRMTLFLVNFVINLYLLS